MLEKAIENMTKECERCREMHYIPEGKKHCVPCMVKIIDIEKHFK